MNDVIELNGFHLFGGFLSGYENLLAHRGKMNEINVFPVADGDTGTNMVSTFRSTVQARGAHRSVSRTLDGIADRALSGARGNSGIIIAQFLSSLAAECAERETVSAAQFASALRRAADGAYRAVETPREGTLLTILRVWSAEMERLAENARGFKDLFTRSMPAARKSLEATTEQLDALRKARVVDAGAYGLVAFLEGIARMIATGAMPRRAPSVYAGDVCSGEEHELPAAEEEISYRYCTEGLLLRGDGVDVAAIKSALRALGDSLAVSVGREKTRVHLHTDDPARAFDLLAGFGRVVDHKVDDMRLQHDAVYRPVSRVAIVTDSIADIPRELAERYQIHVIPQRIIWGDDEYLDRVTLSSESLYRGLGSRPGYPTSSAPDPARVERTFAWLSAHYEAIVAIPVARALSGTWQVMETSARRLRERGYPISVLDSRLNSAAQGLAVLSAAEAAAGGANHGAIAALLEEAFSRARILVGIADFRYMVRGGRVSALKGFVAAVANLKPIVSLDRSGKGVAFGASFSRAGCERRILRAVDRERDSIRRYAVVHAAVPARAALFAAELTRVVGRPPEYVMEISPVVGIHAGVGAVAVAWV